MYGVVQFRGPLFCQEVFYLLNKKDSDYRELMIGIIFDN